MYHIKSMYHLITRQELELSGAYIVYWDQQKYSKKSENIICLDPYILNSFSYLDQNAINVSQCMFVSDEF